MLTKLSLGVVALIGLVAFAGCNKSGTPPVPTRAPASGNTAIVVGGIIPCSGLPMFHGPRYAAGTVTVLRGWPTERSIGYGTFEMVWPKPEVATASVRTNATYRFVLAPGRYTLKGRFPHGNVRPFARLTAKSHKISHVNIPNMCI